MRNITIALLLLIPQAAAAQIRDVEPPAQYAVWFDELKVDCAKLSKSCPTPVRPRLDRRQELSVEFSQIQWRTAPGKTMDCRRDHGCYGVAEMMVSSLWNALEKRWEFEVRAVITLTEDVSDNELVVKHEMLHLLMATGDHPDIFRQLGVDSRSFRVTGR